MTSQSISKSLYIVVRKSGRVLKILNELSRVSTNFKASESLIRVSDEYEKVLRKVKLVS